jgi:hypothetical protein
MVLNHSGTVHYDECINRIREEPLYGTLTVIRQIPQDYAYCCDIMPDPDFRDDSKKTADESAGPDGFHTGLPANMTLETIIEVTGEIEHLNDLVMLALEKEGGFTCTEAYFKTVQPILDLLEVEIRVRYLPGMSKNEMKLIVQDWIDGEIRSLQ